MGRLTRRDWVMGAAALPPALLVVTMLIWLALACTGAHPLWQVEPLTLPEAAARRDAGEVARLLEEGWDPNARYPVRSGFLTAEAVELTPIEAARAADRPEIELILEYAGATPVERQPDAEAP
ncbi:MAG: hypothetical protein FJW23_01055 [Acidimicrobiia bacterium]|nr:hypothetical protein [Acidimicrobiia bacterium]